MKLQEWRGKWENAAIFGLNSAVISHSCSHFNYLFSTEHDSNLLSNLSMTPLGLVMGPAKIWKGVKAPKYFWLLLRPSGFIFKTFYALQKPFFSHYRSSAAACWSCLEWHCIFFSSLKRLYLLLLDYTGDKFILPVVYPVHSFSSSAPPSVPRASWTVTRWRVSWQSTRSTTRTWLCVAMSQLMTSLM